MRKRYFDLEETLGNAVQGRFADDQSFALESELSPGFAREARARTSSFVTADQDDEQADGQHLDRRHPGGIEPDVRESLHNFDSSDSAPQINYATDVINQELDIHSGLRTNRTTILKEALSFIRGVSFSRRESEWISTATSDNVKAVTKPFSEVIYMALRSIAETRCIALWPSIS